MDARMIEVAAAIADAELTDCAKCAVEAWIAEAYPFAGPCAEQDSLAQ